MPDYQINKNEGKNEYKCATKTSSDTTARASISNGKVDEDSVSKWSVSPYDEYLVEAGLQLKETLVGAQSQLLVALKEQKKMLTDAAAVGADTLVHIPIEGAKDSTHVQKLLAAAVERFDSSVILCGKQAADTNGGSTGPGVAELIGAACVTFSFRSKFSDGKFTTIRPSNSGIEKVMVDSLSVFAFDKGSSELRRP